MVEAAQQVARRAPWGRVTRRAKVRSRGGEHHYRRPEDGTRLERAMGNAGSRFARDDTPCGGASRWASRRLILSRAKVQFHGENGLFPSRNQY